MCEPWICSFLTNHCLCNIFPLFSPPLFGSRIFFFFGICFPDSSPPKGWGCPQAQQFLGLEECLLNLLAITDSVQFCYHYFGRSYILLILLENRLLLWFHTDMSYGRFFFFTIALVLREFMCHIGHTKSSCYHRFCPILLSLPWEDHIYS